MISVPIGALGRMSIRPGIEDLAASIGNAGVNLVSTPAVIGFLEHVAHLAIQPYFLESDVSVGTRVDIQHKSAANSDDELICTARVIAISGRRITFDVRAEQVGRTIMLGTHERAILDKSRLKGTATADKPSNPVRTVVTFWFDFHSPWSYLAATRINGIVARHDVTVLWRPLHLANLIDRINGRRVLSENNSFLEWYKRDMQDWADLYGVAIRYHPDFPIRPARALRASIYAASVGSASPFVVRVMRAYWEEAEDISDLDVLGRLAVDVGLPSEAIKSAAQDDVFKEKLRANNVEAIKSGIFGVPSFAVDGTIFFGNDRILMLDRHLGGDALSRFAAGLL